MAKMRYSEMPRDTSTDSLRTIQEVYEKEKRSPECVEKLGGLLMTMNGRGGGNTRKSERDDEEDRLIANREEEEELMTITCGGKKASESEAVVTTRRLPKAPTSHRLAPPACYDNPAAWKSQSLPGACLKDLDGLVLEALRVSPEDLASQLTLLDLAAFVRIAPSELTSTAWNKRNKLTAAPNVVAFTQRFNHVSFWTVQEVLSGTTPKHRAEITSHFIRTCKKLYELNNFHSLFAIISALQSASVYRLSKSWSHVAKKDRQTFEKLAEVFSDKNNWQSLREHIENLKLPCIPYLGVFLTDLVYIEMAHPIKEQRGSKMERVLNVVAALQASTYPSLPTLPVVQRYLASVRYIDELQKFLEDDHYKLSLRLEPPSPMASSCSSKESVADGSIGSLSLSPAKFSVNNKFTPGHRKSSSLGSKLRSASLPRNLHKFTGGAVQANCPHICILSSQSTGRHLLDDSVLEEGSQLSNVKALQHLNLSPLKRLPVMHDDEMQVKMQGALRRKTLLKEGKKPTVASWQRYWVQLWANCLVFYLPKAFKGNERCDYKKEPCKVAPMTGCLVSLSDNPLHPDIFHLRDPIKSNLYKFRAGSREDAHNWLTALQETLGLTLDHNPTNLITFE